MREQCQHFHTEGEKGDGKGGVLEDGWVVDKGKKQGGIYGDTEETDGNEIEEAPKGCIRNFTPLPVHPGPQGWEEESEYDWKAYEHVAEASHC